MKICISFILVSIIYYFFYLNWSIINFPGNDLYQYYYAYSSLQQDGLALTSLRTGGSDLGFWLILYPFSVLNFTFINALLSVFIILTFYVIIRNLSVSLYFLIIMMFIFMLPSSWGVFSNAIRQGAALIPALGFLVTVIKSPDKSYKKIDLLLISITLHYSTVIILLILYLYHVLKSKKIVKKTFKSYIFFVLSIIFFEYLNVFEILYSKVNVYLNSYNADGTSFSPLFVSFIFLIFIFLKVIIFNGYMVSSFYLFFLVVLLNFLYLKFNLIGVNRLLISLLPMLFIISFYNIKPKFKSRMKYD